jgi:hypothetical protein
LLLECFDIVFRRVDASLYCIAGVFCARIDVSANDWGVGAFSGSLVARVGGASVVIVTVLSNILAVSSGGVARINSACVFVITILWISVKSVLAIASRDGAKISCSWNWDWCVDAFSCRARVLGASVVIVTNNWGVDATNRKIASINYACIAIIADLWCVDTSLLGIASIYCAFVLISANDRSVDTSSAGGIASISCAHVIIVAINSFLVESLVKSAEPNLAFVAAS